MSKKIENKKVTAVKTDGRMGFIGGQEYEVEYSEIKVEGMTLLKVGRGVKWIRNTWFTKEG